MFRKPLWSIFALYCIAIVWLVINAFTAKGITICPFKLITSHPCPACGTTTAILLIFKGEIITALKHNLNVVFIVPCALIYTFSIFSDFLFHTHITPYIYNRTLNILKHKSVLYAFLAFECFVWYLHFI